MPDTIPADVSRYLDAVRGALADVPDDERAGLLDDLEQHLAEVAAESPEPLQDRLGSPAAYAADLRASAGLADTAGPESPRRYRLALARQRVARFTADRRVAATAAFVGELRPAWWVLRGCLLVVLLNGIAGRLALPVPRVLGSRLIGLLALVAAVVASVRLGQRTAREPRSSPGWLLLGLNLVAAFAAVVTGWHLVNVERDSLVPVYADQVRLGPSDRGLRVDGRRVTNVFPYDAQGRPLEQVFLYDQRGRSLDVIVERTRRGEIVTSYPLSRSGEPVTNVFPQRQGPRSGDRRRPGSTGADRPVIGGPPVVPVPDLAPVPAPDPPEATVTPPRPSPTEPTAPRASPRPLEMRDDGP